MAFRGPLFSLLETEAEAEAEAGAEVDVDVWMKILLLTHPSLATSART